MKPYIPTKNKFIRCCRSHVLICGCLFWLFSFPLFSQSEKAHVFLFGGLNHYFQYGSEEDYIQGINDFPVNPSHNTLNLGVAVGLFFTSHFGAEIDGRYNFSSEIKLTDPSDHDSLLMQTSKNISLTASLIFLFSNKKIQPYFLAGGGINRLIFEEADYITEYGYEISLREPDENDSVDPVLNFGGGVNIKFNRNVGMRVDLRYSIIFDDIDTISCLNTTFGFLIYL